LLFKIKVENEDINVFVRTRPNLWLFMHEMSKIYEVVVFTASLSEVRLNDACVYS